MPIRVKMSHCWKSHVAAHILKTEEITIVEVQRYRLDERILVSPNKIEKRYCKMRTFNKNKYIYD